MSNDETPVIADIYARISQDKHEDDQYAGLNVDDQIEKCRDWIEKRGWSVGEIYRDNSISATSGAARPAFEQMLVDNARPLIYWRQDRLERNPMDLERFLVSGREGYGTDGTRATLESANAEFVTKLLSQVHRLEQRVKAERIKAANLRYAKAGKYRGSIRPFGQTRAGEWVDGESEAVRSAAAALVSGESTFYDIAKQWNAAGMLTPQTKNKSGKEWTSGTVRNYFTRPRLIGLQDYNGTLYELADWTPLLDKDTYEQLQTLIDSKRTGKRGISTGRGDARLLTGIVKCECGRGMNVGYRGPVTSPRIYRCPTVGHQSVTAEALERVVTLHALDLMSRQDEGKAEAEEASNRIAELLDAKRAAQSAHAAWIEEAVAARPRLSPALIAKAEEVHLQELSDFDAEIMRHRAALGVNLFAVSHEWRNGTLETDLTGWEATPMARRRDVLKSLFNGVLVDRGGQGQRFNRKRVTYDHTPLGEALYDRWSEDTAPPVDAGGRQ